MKCTKHNFDAKETKILDSDPKWFQRGVKEAIYIASVKPDLNQDSGRHHLPKTYKNLIGSCDLSNNTRSRDPIRGNASSSSTQPQC